MGGVQTQLKALYTVVEVRGRIAKYLFQLSGLRLKEGLGMSEFGRLWKHSDLTNLVGRLTNRSFQFKKP